MATQTIPQIPVEPRSKIGTAQARRLRKDSRLPIVIYGHGQDPVHVHADYKQATDVLHEGWHLIEAVLDGTAESCLIKDVQWDAFGRQILHVDLTRVDLSEKVEVEVEIDFHGDPKSLEEPGAVMSHPREMLTIACRADSIPQRIRVEVGHMEVGDNIAAGDVKLPEGVELVDDPETIIALISIVAELPEEEEETEVDESAEPEVIGREEEEEEDEEKED